MITLKAKDMKEEITERARRTGDKRQDILYAILITLEEILEELKK